jgi:serine/threonine protein kinase/formylglycine-generating enzyme required for sulfatase activity
MNEEALFADAIAIESPEERRRFLDAACAGDPVLRQGVEKLLTLADQAGSFLEHPPAGLAGESDATLLVDNGATWEDGLGTSDFVRHGAEAMTELCEGDSDEIPLGYLQSSTRPDAIGRLAHYEILEVIGRGAFGTVLRAFDEKLRRVVAIKVLAPEMAATSPARKRFLREARTSAAIRHENVVGIHSVEDDPIPYLVMEYIPGRTLQQRLDEHGPLDLIDVLKLGKQIADGLAAAHGEGLIHRDIKPGNILLEGGMDERVKITDFGLARTADDASMTQSGMIAGTPLYMAPEQAQGHKLDQRADLFSLGSVLYQMLTGRPPFRAPSTVAVLRRVVDDTPRPMREIIPEIPNWLSDLVGHLHAKQPDERYQSAKEISELLARCLEDLKAGRTPKIPDPTNAGGDCAEVATVVDSELNRSRRHEGRCQIPLTGVAAAVVILLSVLGITEATGVTKLASTVVRLTTGSGTLVIETDDPGVKIAINGEEVTITGGGVEELSLRPGQYQVAAVKGGVPVRQELVSITRNGRTTVRMLLDRGGRANERDLHQIENGGAAGQSSAALSPVQLRRFASGEWVDVIPLIDPQADKWDLAWTGANDWRIERGELVVGDTDEQANKLILPLDVEGPGLEMEIAFTRRSGSTGFIVNLPNANGDVPLVFDAPGLSGLALGRRGKSEVLSIAPQIETGQQTQIHIELRHENEKDRLAVVRDGEAVATWIGNRNDVPGYSDEGYPHHRRVSLFTFPGGSGIVFHRIRLRMLDGGTATTLRSVPSARSSAWPAAAPPLAIAPFDATQAQAHQEAWSGYLGVPVEYENSIGMKFRLIPPGEFLMGSTAEEIETALNVAVEDKYLQEIIRSEGPQHRVILTRPLYVGVTEVTQSQYEQVMGMNPSHFSATGGGKELVATVETGNHPVETVSWNDAAEFCAKLSQREGLKPFYIRSGETIAPLEGTGYRLPTEAEWEHACRAGTTTLFWSGDGDHDLASAGWSGSTSGGRTHVVGELRANPFGLSDVHGNVWEWVQDSWDPAFYERFNEGPAVDPFSPFSVGSQRGLRGGDWNNRPPRYRSSHRDNCPATYRHDHIGFRVVLVADAVKQLLSVSSLETTSRAPLAGPHAPVTRP